MVHKGENSEILAYDATETAIECRDWLLYFGLRLDNILHTGMFLPGINGHLVTKLVLQVSVSSCFRGKTRFMTALFFIEQGRL
jgi:hypothetical protein